MGVDVVNICATPPVVCWAQNRRLPHSMQAAKPGGGGGGGGGDGIEKGRLAEVREVMHTEAKSRFL